MFSGIIKEVGRVSTITKAAEVRKLKISSAMFTQDAANTVSSSAVNVGDSICVSGVCLTVASLQSDVICCAEFDLGTETIRSTNLGQLELNSTVNLERSLCLGERVDGHLVQGHVDTTTEILAREMEGNTVCFKLGLPAKVKDLVAQKGSVALDGVSLTVASLGLDPDWFSVYIIPHTLAVTTLHERKVGDLLNLEVDMVARYLRRIAATYLSK